MSSDRLPLALLPLLLATTTGCPGSLDNKEAFLQAEGGGSATSTGTNGTGTGGGIPADDPCDGLITLRCAVPGCHVEGRTPPDLSYDGRVERILDVPGPVCDDQLLVSSSAPEESLMYTKCAEATPECGTQMPFGREKLDDEELACLLEWIQSL
jgi:hypothetical protein